MKIVESGPLVENFTIVGNPTIVDGILTPNSTSWITTPSAFNPGSNSWELTTKIYRPNFKGAYEIIIDGGIRIRTAWQSQNCKLYLYSENGTISDGAKNKAVPKTSWRWLKVAFNGSKYDYAVSSDGVEFIWQSNNTTAFSSNAVSSTTPIKSGVIQFGSSNTDAQIDLYQTNIKVNGAVWWSAYVRG